jgi:hypothetical protein
MAAWTARAVAGHAGRLRLVARFKRFCNAYNRSGISIVWVAPNGGISCARAPGQTDEIVQAALDEAREPGTIVDLA